MFETDEIHVLGIIGSPRRNGNTEILVDQILSGATAGGAQIGKIILNELDISPCNACDACRDSRKCVFDDDMNIVLEMMDQSQIWILGTPIYWWGPTAQMKTFIDRWYGTKHARFQGKNVILALPQGGSNERYAQPTVDMFRSIMDYLGMKHQSTIVVPGVYQRGVISEKRRILNNAYQIGLEAVESITISDYDSVLQGLSMNPPSDSPVSDSD